MQNQARSTSWASAINPSIATGRHRLAGQCLQEFIDTAMRWVYGWSQLVTGRKEAEVAEVKPSQNLLWHTKAALNPHKFRQLVAKSVSNNDKK